MSSGCDRAASTNQVLTGGIQLGEQGESNADVILTIDGGRDMCHMAHCCHFSKQDLHDESP